MSLTTAIQGFALGASMIIPIGAQNSFILNQGIKKNHHLTAATICMLSDVLLICLGIFGGSQLINQSPTMMTAITWGGILFLTVYGLLSFRSVITAGASETNGTASLLSFKAVIVTTLAVTLLNPHVYLDTVVILGSVGGQFNGNDKIVFALGCVLASIVWFYSLSLAAAKLSPLLSKKRSKQCIDFVVGAIMWIIAYGLFQSWLQNGST